jgi:hypothetical protein
MAGRGPGHSRFCQVLASKTWMPGTKPGHDVDLGFEHETWLPPYSCLSMFQKIGVAGPSSTPVSDLRHTLGAKYCPSGM